MKKFSGILKFYGDTSEKKNHLYHFKVNNIEDARNAITRFTTKGIKVRAGWYTPYKNGIACVGVRIV